MCCVVLFFKRIRSVSKARETGIGLQEGFCIRPWANKGNREILKWAIPKADRDLSSKSPPWVDGEGILLASKHHTSKQWGSLPLAARAESQSLCSGKQGPKCSISLPHMPVLL